jgi:Domain of unknown function (DUF2017)
VGNHGARQLSPLFSRRLIRFNRQSGKYDLNLAAEYRTMLKELVPQFEALLEDPGNPVVHRLFPPAYSDPAHVEQQDEYRRLMQDDLVAHRREELELIAATADSKSLTGEELLAWSRALNSIRLVLGTFLDVGEDDERRAPTTPEESLYHWLTFLLGEAIDALSGQN